MKDNDGEAREKKTRCLLVVFSALYVTLLAGAFFGYGPMQLMLEDHGAFSNTCPEDDQEDEIPCASQTSRLLQVHFIAQLTLTFSPIAGIIADRYSAKALMYLTSAVGVLGLVCLLIATGFRIDNLLFVSDLLLGLMSVCSSVMVVQTGLVFTKTTRQRIISALNTLYDAGALTYLALWAIENALDCGITAIVAGYLGVAIVVFGGAIYCWQHVVPVQEDDTVLAEDDAVEESVSQELDPVEESFDENEASNVTSTIRTNEKKQDQSQTAEPTDSDYVLISNQTPSQQLKSKLYVILCIFFALHGTKNNFTITTARDFLAYLGDDEVGNKYLTIFTLMTPVSILGLPFMDFILNRWGYHAGFQSINVLSLAHGIILTSSDNLNVQILGFIIFSFFRCFLFTISFSFVPTFMSQSVVGRGSGIMTFWFGVLSFVNIGLSSWAVSQTYSYYYVIFAIVESFNSSSR